MVDAELIAKRVEEVRQRIDAAGGRPDRVTIVGITKTVDVEVARAAVDAGLEDLGENYAQELEAKADAIDRTAVRWHMVGGVQRNKVRRLAGRVHLWQTVDRSELGLAIARRSPGAAVLVQVNTTGEPQKTGCRPSDVAALVDDLVGAALDVRGLMTIGPTDTACDPRPGFSMLRDLGQRLALPELSMGMTGDFEAAVAEGSTMVRIGTALFGPRPR